MTINVVEGDDDHQVIEKKNILVGIRLDECGKELLDWALFKVAETGDRVIAINICPNSDSTSNYQTLLDDYLVDYESLCDQKQVDLIAKVLRGNSVRRILVNEARFYSTKTVIVGVNKLKSFGGWLSIATYCAKKLPLATEVLAIQNGKVVFKRPSSCQISGSMRDPRPSLNSDLKDSQSEFGELEMGRRSCEDGHSLRDGDISSFEMRRKGLSSVSVVVEDFGQQRPGWPLLRATSLLTPSAMEARKMSVVKWVMNLPSRSFRGTPITPSSSSEVSPKSSGCDSTSEYSILTGTNSFDHYNKPRYDELHEILNVVLNTNPSGCQWIGFDLLSTSTSHFSSDNLIGNGGCHRVYKGQFPDGKLVAVKMRKSSRDAWKDYLLEIDIMTSLTHKNISPLHGICVENDNLISIYDFVPNGNLEDNIHGNKERKSALSWEVRRNVAIGVAEALKYLHTKCRRPVVHRDVKSSNILLTNNYEPQLTDFGLALWGPTTSPDVVGTFGYLAPEYFMYGKVTEKIDVYAFGVVLLELLTGKRAIRLAPTKGEDSLVMWAKPKLDKGDLASILDSDLDTEVKKVQIAQMALAATLCLTQSSKRRPTMNQVLKILRGDEPMKDWVENYRLEDLDGSEDYDDEVYPESNTESHLSLVFLDVNDKSTPFGMVDTNHYDTRRSLRECLRGR